MAIATTIIITSATIAISITVNPLLPGPSAARVCFGWIARLGRRAFRRESRLRHADRSACHISLHSRNNIPQTLRETDSDPCPQAANRMLGNRLLSYVPGGLLKRTDARSAI